MSITIIVSYLLLLLAVHRGLRAHQEKRVTNWLILTRLLILALLVLALTGCFINLPHWQGVNWLHLGQAGFLALAYVFAEAAFRQKKERFISPHRVWSLEAFLLMGLVLLPW